MNGFTRRQEPRLTEFDPDSNHVRTECEGYRVLEATSVDGAPVLVHEIALSGDVSISQRDQLAESLTRLVNLEVDGYLAPLSFQLDVNQAVVVLPAGPKQRLADLISSGPLGVPETLALADRLLVTLSDLHGHGLLNLGLRPTDIFIGDDGRPILAGVGPLCLVASALSDVVAKDLATYAAPETLGGLRDTPGPSADLYSLGVILFESLCGAAPFQGASSGDRLFQHLTQRVPQLRTSASGASSALNEVVQRLLRKAPRDRYQSADGVRHDIQQLNSEAAFVVPGTRDIRATITEPSIVGRESEVKSLEAAMRNVAAGGRETMLVRGPSGVGRSRFLVEVRELAERSDFRVLVAKATNQSGQTPFAALQAVFAECARWVEEDEDVAAALQRVGSEFSQELHASAPELAAALNLETTGQRELTDKRIAFALASVIGTLGAARPVMLLVDDVQWADELSLAVLESWRLVDSSRTILLASVAADAVYDSLVERLGIHDVLELNDLTHPQTDLLLESMAGPLPTVLKETVWKRSNGNPFAAAALLRGFEEGGVLQPRSSGWSLDTEQLLNLRVSVEAGEVLSSRFSRLSDEAQRFLAAAAVLGVTFRIETAAQIAGVSREVCERLLEEARRAHLIWNDTNECVFAHAQVREAAQQGQSAAQRRKLHLNAAKLYVETSRHRSFDIAWHFDAADRPKEALGYALVAAEKARAVHSLATARSQYEIVLRSHEKLETAPSMETLQGFGIVLTLDGRYSEAEVQLRRAEEAADRPIDRAQLLLRRGELAFKMDDKLLAIQRWEQALGALGRKLPSGWQILGGAGIQVFVQTLHTWLPRWFVGNKQNPDDADRLAWKLFSRLAHGYWYVSSQASVLYAHLRGLNEAERFPPTPELAQAYSEHSPAMSLIPLSRRGIAYGRRSFEIRTTQGDLWGQGQSLHFLAIALYSAGRFEECIEVGQRGVEILNRAGDYWEKHIAQYQVAASMFRLGRFVEAVELAEEAYSSGLAVGDFQACANLAEIWTRATGGQIPGEVIEQEMQRPRSDVQGIAHVLLARGVQLIAVQQYDAAVAVLDDGIAQAAAAGVTNTYTSPLPAWKATALRLSLRDTSLVTRSRLEEIRKDHRRTARQALLMALRFKNELPHALREYAWAHLMAGRTRTALWLFSRSHHIAVKQSAQFEVLQTEVDFQQVRAELGKSGAQVALENAEHELREFRIAQLPAPKVVESVSLADRFDTLLTSGREIASTVQPEDVKSATLASAQRMLRCDNCELPAVNEAGEVPSVPDFMQPLVAESLQQRDARVFSLQNQDCRSLIVAPVFVRGQVAACLLASSKVNDMFGEDDARLARYITAIAGAALENADGFRQLRDLNENLENIVEERTAAVEARSKKVQEQADELRTTQVELAAARDAAEIASEAKTAFLAQMSHEIRTPLGAVLGFTELLLRTSLQPEQRENLNRVHSNGAHLHCLLNDLLDLSRIEAGEMTVENIVCEPFSLVFDVLQALQSKAHEKEISLTARVVDRVPEQIRTDPTRLRQILTNLIGNAIKFTDEGGVHLLIETDLARQQLVIQVCDSGVGMKQSTLEEIFEPFRQADDTIARRFGGTGLGLSISRQLANALGGDVAVESEPGTGSTFTVRVSTGTLHQTRLWDNEEALESIRKHQELQTIDVDLTGRRVLLADDCESNRVLFTHMLNTGHADCTVVCNGQEAVDALVRAPDDFDMLITDMQMPVLDGYATTTKLRELGFTLPIVALTANGMLDNEARCSAMGFTGYLTKPISTNALLAAVAEQLKIEVRPRRAAPEAEVPSAAQSVAIPNLNAEFPTDELRHDLALRFLVKVRERMALLVSAVEESDVDKLRELGHWLKGTGGMLLPMIGEFGVEIESAAAAGDFQGVLVLVDALDVTVDQLWESGSAGGLSPKVPSGDLL